MNSKCIISSSNNDVIFTPIIKYNSLNNDVFFSSFNKIPLRRDLSEKFSMFNLTFVPKLNNNEVLFDDNGSKFFKTKVLTINNGNIDDKIQVILPLGYLYFIRYHYYYFLNIHKLNPYNENIISYNDYMSKYFVKIAGFTSEGYPYDYDKDLIMINTL